MAESAGTTGPEGGSPRPIRTVLLVEDNMLIALDTEDALRLAGVETVLIAATAEAALAELARRAPDFADRVRPAAIRGWPEISWREA